MLNISVSATSFIKNPQLTLQLRDAFPNASVKFASPDSELAGEALKAFYQDTDLALIGKEPVDRDFFQSLPRLKAISKYGVGIDNVDEESCKEFGVSLLYTPGVNAQAVAEMTIGLILSTMRNISQSDRLLKEGTWKKDGGHQFSGKTVGIIGCGAVGSKVARLAKAFGCPLMLCDIKNIDALANETGGIISDRNSLLSESDIVTLHVPLTDQTKGFIDQKAFAQMKTSAFIVNTSRGEVVNENDLKNALCHNQIRGAALDVWNNEPRPDPELVRYPRLTATPHISANSLEAVSAMGQAAIQGLLDFCRSERISI